MTKQVNKLDYLMRVNQRNINLIKNQTISISDEEYNELWPLPNNIITYKASAKLAETTRDYNSGLHTNAFNTTIKSHTFENGVGTIEFNGDVTSIGNRAFYHCSGLTSITIPNSVTSIGNNAFYNCSGLTSCTIGSGVTSIGSYAFSSCGSLTSIVIPDSVTNIGQYAFQRCSGLTSIDIPDSVTSIGGHAFNGCLFQINDFINNSSLDEVANNYWDAIVYDTNIDGLLIRNNVAVKYIGTSDTLTIPDSVTSIGQYAFSSCGSLTSIDVPNSVTSIGNNAFYNCSGLTSCTIGSGVTSIGDMAFEGCSSLTSIVIPDSVTSIGDEAFYECTDLTSCTIGSGVTSIGQYVFSWCSSLTSITSNRTTAPTIQSNTFQNIKTSGTLTVPSGSSGYSVWMGTGNYYLGKYGWTKVEQ